VAVYRASFRQTFAEMNAPTGEWRSILAGVLFAISLSGWMLMYVRKFGKITCLMLSLSPHLPVFVSAALLFTVDAEVY